MGPKWFICLKQFFFWKKLLISFSSTNWPLSFYKIFKKMLRASPELWRCAIFGPRIPQFLLNKIFWYKPLLLSSTYWPFPLGKIFKKILQWILSYEDAPFLGPKWSICPKQFLFRKILNIILIYLLARFIVQNFKKNPSRGSRIMRMCNFWTQIGPFPQIRNFFPENLLISLVSFTHTYLHAKNQSQIFIC